MIELSGVLAEGFFRVWRKLDERFENLGGHRSSDLRASPKVRIEGEEILFVAVGVGVVFRKLGGFAQTRDVMVLVVVVRVFVCVLFLMAVTVRIREEFEPATQVDDHGVRSDRLDIGEKTLFNG